MKILAILLCVCVMVSPIFGHPDDRNAAWDPAHESNYTQGRQGGKVQYVVIHIVQGSYQGCISWFKNPAANVSAHYVVSNGGSITQMVSESNIAWHAGNWTYNKNSVGIEHEGYVTNKSFPDAMYRNSASLVRAICNRYGVPLDRKHIIGHNEVPGATHTDPGNNWDWNKFMSYVKSRDVEETQSFYAEAETTEYKAQLQKVVFNKEEIEKTVNAYTNGTLTVTDVVSCDRDIDVSVFDNLSSFDCKNHIPSCGEEQEIEYNNDSSNAKQLCLYYDIYTLEIWKKEPQQEWQKFGNAEIKKFKGYELKD